MILSHKLKVVFIKGAKVAGSSIELALAQLCGPDDVVTGLMAIDNSRREGLGALQPQNFKREDGTHKYRNHMQLREVINEFGPIPADWLMTYCVRNPYATVISLANFWLRMSDYDNGRSTISEDEEIREKIISLFETDEYLMARNIDRYYLPDGTVPPHFLRYENLEADFVGLMRRLGVNRPPQLPHVKKAVMANRLNPRDYLTPALIERINDEFSAEFSTFGYEKISPIPGGRT